MKTGWTALIVIALLGIAPEAPAQAPSATAAAAAKKPDAKKPDAKKPDAKSADAKPADKGQDEAHDAKDPGTDALPAGHPPVDDSMPPDHPSVGDDGDDDTDEPPQQNPHAQNPHGQNPHGGPGGGDPRFFRPPPDTAEDDPALPAGTIDVAIKDAQDKPIPGAEITLGVLHSSVAKGDSREKKSATADGDGAARFGGLEVGSGTTYRVVTNRGPAEFAITPFALGDKIGKRVIVHMYEVTTNIDDAMVGMQGLVYLALREDTIEVEHLFSIFNLGSKAWAADVKIDLPAGFKAFNKPDAMGDIRFDEMKGGAALRGTISPGRHDVNFRYQVPLDETDRQVIRIQVPPHVAEARVIAESSKTMGLSVQGFPPAQKAQNRDGKRVLVTERQVTRAEGGITEIEITLTGLPTPGPGRWIAVAIAALSLVIGFAYLRQSQVSGEIDEDTRSDLVDAREALLGEIVTLERMRKKGEVGPRSYARLRASLLDALARIVSMLDAGKKRGRAVYREAADGADQEGAA